MTHISATKTFKRAMFALAFGAAIAVFAVAPAFASGEVGSGGGGGGGGGTTTTTTLSPCAQISNFKATGGVYRVWGAIWVNYTVKNCGPAEGLSITVSETDTATGVTEWISPAYTYLKTNDSYSSPTLDNDFTAQGTTYLVTITVTEYTTGAVLATQSLSSTTGTKVGP